jgi:hypothetical protein
MSQIKKRIDDKVVYFSDHALDRWWERCEENEVNGRSRAIRLLRESLNECRLLPSGPMPSWVRDSAKSRLRNNQKGFLSLDNDNGFVIVEDGKGKFVAVTFLSKLAEPN